MSYIGKKHSEESKKKMSIKQKEKWTRLRANTAAYNSFLEKTSKSSKGRIFPKGELSKSWKGGKYIDSRDGYVFIRDLQHPFKRSDGYILEHRLVMEKMLGRYLTPEEDVNHINGDKKDNRPENLRLVRHHAHYEEHKCPKCEFIFWTR